jgi:hypothetical protein
VSVSVAVNDASVFWSPGQWDISGSTFARTNSAGNYLKFSTSGASDVDLNVDVSVLSGNSVLAANYPMIAYQVDGGAISRTQLASGNTTLRVGASLGGGSHTFKVSLDGLGFADDKWTTPVSALKVTGLTLDAGAIAAPTLRPYRAIFFGDSIEEGQEARGAGETVAHQGGILSWAQLLADDLNAEHASVGYGGTGWLKTGNSNLPAFVDFYGNYSSGRSKLSGGLFPVTYDWIGISLGTNDTANGALTTEVTAQIGRLRTAAPTTAIWVFLPPNLHAETEIRAGFTAAADANSLLIDHDEDLTAYTAAPLNVHLLAAGHARYANLLIDRIPVRSVCYRSV